MQQEFRDGPLAGRLIVVPEGRELDLFAGMLERHGAATLRCPMISIFDLADTAPVEAWLRRLIAGAHDDVVLTTGEGLNRLLGVARQAGIEGDAVAALGRARKIVRGPKPVRALRAVGLAPDLSAAEPTTDGVIDMLRREDLRGRRVGLQLYPEAPATLPDFLRQAGAEVDAVTPYRYADAVEDERVVEVIDAMAAGRIDLVAFTSSPQVRRLRDVALATGREEHLRDGLRRTRIAAVGPVVAEAVAAIGGRVDIEPEKLFHMKPMVGEIVAVLGAARP